ncbi:uncharacterized protein KD926_010717 [Aspergillus affinis]|uniref:uncharacterized protein n=1 Tax=Aspergillus affinis TaxID=1070780 RepID=UPI0022FDE306|nr:uncharacterized protein KD926_010717 [Aspergillus affinis]KAI9038505.1 hypothetical protein KD926_010717 [Aspergillus affinis]
MGRRDARLINSFLPFFSVMPCRGAFVSFDIATFSPSNGDRTLKHIAINFAAGLECNPVKYLCLSDFAAQRRDARLLHRKSTPGGYELLVNPAGITKAIEMNGGPLCQQTARPSTMGCKWNVEQLDPGANQNPPTSRSPPLHTLPIVSIQFSDLRPSLARSLLIWLGFLGRDDRQRDGHWSPR